MLIRFVYENVLSFKEETEFNMLPAKSQKAHTDHLLQVTPKISVLKGAIVYGANGAGKSNLIKGAEIMRNIVVKGNIPSDLRFIRNKMSDPETPVSLDCEFSIGGKVYDYGVSFTDGLCLSEWLYDTSTEKERLVFTREYSSEKERPVLTFSAEFMKKKANTYLKELLETKLLKNNQVLLFLRDIIEEQNILNAYTWFEKKLFVVFPNVKSTYIFDDMYSNSEFKSYSERVLSNLDVGIKNITFKKEDLNKFLMEVPVLDKTVFDEAMQNLKEKESGIIDTDHFTISMERSGDKIIVRRITMTHEVEGKEYQFELKEESDGTQRLLDFIPMIRDIQSYDRVVMIDEIDRSIHPNLLLELISKVMEENLTGQIICSSHESNLLSCDIFRTDEIWFAEKDRETQCTKLYTLNDFKPRNDLDIRKGYLQGRFGAIPFLAQLESLKWNRSDAAQE